MLSSVVDVPMAREVAMGRLLTLTVLQSDV